MLGLHGIQGASFCRIGLKASVRSRRLTTIGLSRRFLAGSQAAAYNHESEMHVVLFTTCFFGRGFDSRRLHHFPECPWDACLRSAPATYILPEVVGGYLKPYWNRRLFTTFVVCFANLQPAFPQTAQWTPFSSKEAQFSVSFCGAPTADPPTVDKKGAITGTVRLFRAGGENYFCMVGYSEYNIMPAVEEELRLNQTNFIKAVNGTVGTSRRTEFVHGSNKLPALTFTFEMPPNHTGK